MIKIRALFIGGPADGKRMEIDARQFAIQIPNEPEPLTLLEAQKWTGWQNGPPPATISFTTYRVHILDLRVHGQVAVCTTDFELDYHGVLVALLEGYNPKKEQAE